MPAVTTIPQTALKYEAEVTEEGRIELQLPFLPGERVVIFVVKEVADGWDDLINASQTTLDFWDNPFDDEDWNDA